MSIFLGATINDEHTLRDWKAAITNADVISVPEANTVILEVPGRNGNLDLSEALTGDVTYRNREIKLELASSVNLQTWYQKCLHIFNTYHGKTVTIIFDDDSTHYYTGRASVSDPQRVRNGGAFIFTVNADPFRYSITEKIVTAAVHDNQRDVLLWDGLHLWRRKPVYGLFLRHPLQPFLLLILKMEKPFWRKRRLISRQQRPDSQSPLKMVRSSSIQAWCWDTRKAALVNM